MSHSATVRFLHRQYILIIPELVTTVNHKLHSFLILDGCADVALMADIWTDPRAHVFLGVTIQFPSWCSCLTYLGIQ